MFLPAKAYEEFDPHIRELVKSLHGIGLGTRSSCEGHLDPERYTRPYPHVSIDVKHPASSRSFLVRLLGLLGEWNCSGKGVWCLRPIALVHGGEEILVLYLEPEERNSQQDLAILQALQAEAKDLASFMLERGRHLSKPGASES